MRTVSADLAAAIAAPERTVRATLSIDWDGDGHGPGTIAATFGVTTSNGWPAADTGQPWSSTGGVAGDYSSSAGTARMSVGAVGAERVMVATGRTLSGDLDARVRVSTAVVAAGAFINTYLLLDNVDAANRYLVRLAFGTDQTVSVQVQSNVAGVFDAGEQVVQPGVTHVAGAWYWLRCQIAGGEVRVKTWRDTTTEPAGWTVVQPDTAALPPGTVGLRAFLSAGSTAALPVVVQFDDLTVTGVNIDDVSSKIGSLQVARDFTKTLPAEVLVVEGTGASTATADLVKGDTADERRGAVQYWSRFNPASPLYGKTRASRDARVGVEFLTASGWQSVPRMTKGVLRNLPVSVGRLQAELELLDARDRFRTPITLPAMIADDPGTNTSTRPGLEASWIASYVMWRCGYPLSPPPPTATPSLWIPGHGSLMPFVQRQYGGTPTSYLFDFDSNTSRRALFMTDAPFYLAADVRANQQITINGQLSADAPPAWSRADGRSAGRFEGWVKFVAGYTATPMRFAAGPADQGNYPHVAQLEVLTTGVMRLTLTNNSVNVVVNGPTVPFDGAWRRIGVHWDDNAGRALFIVGSVTTLVTFAPTTASAKGVPPNLSVWESTYRAPAAELLFVTGLAESAPWQPLVWSAGATVDRLQNRDLGGIYPPTTAPEAWSLLGALLGVEQGLAWIDYDGRPQVWSRGRLVKTPALVAQVTLTARSSIFDLAYDDSRDMIRNIIRVPYKQLTLRKRVTVFTLDTVVQLASGERRSWDITIDPLASIDLSVFGEAHSNASGTLDQVPVGLTLDAGILVTLTTPSPTSLRLELYNHFGKTMYLVDTNGKPSIRVEADVLAQSDGPPQEFRDPASIARYGEKVLDVPASDWRQSIGLAKGQAAQLGALLRDEQVVFTALDVAGDPRLEPWDRVRVVDDAGLMVDTPLTVEAITDKIDTRFDQQLVARPARAQYIVGGPGVGTPLGSTLTGA